MRSCIPSIFLSTAPEVPILKPEDYRNVSDEFAHVLVIRKSTKRCHHKTAHSYRLYALHSILFNLTAVVFTTVHGGDTTPNPQLRALRCLAVPVRRIGGRRKFLLLNHLPGAEEPKSLIN